MKTSMKTGNYLLAAALAVFSLTACKKTNTAAALEEIETTFDISTKQAIADNLTQDDNDILDEVAASNDLSGNYTMGPIIVMDIIGSCAVITISGNFPAKNIKIDFGAGCTNGAGVTRKGIINIVLTDSIRKTGSIATVTFNNYYINNFKKEGTITWTNTTVAGSNTPSWNRKVENGKISAPSGDFWLHTANISITQTAGANTPNNLTDDIFTISGTRTTSNAAGRSRTATTITALQKKTACSNIDKGQLQVQGANHIAVIDFGDGSCDRLATISIDGNTPRTILLR